jgi:hypothetical protein
MSSLTGAILAGIHFYRDIKEIKGRNTRRRAAFQSVLAEAVEDPGQPAPRFNGAHSILSFKTLADLSRKINKVPS